MQLKLLLYIGLLALGMILSRASLFGERLFSRIERIQMACLMLLLFTMGVNLGMNDEIIKSLGTIGAKGVIFGLTTIVFSVLFVHLASKFFLKGVKKVD